MNKPPYNYFTKPDHILKRFFNADNFHTSLKIGIFVAMLILAICKVCGAETTPPDNLWQGLIAEDTQGNYEVYLCIASVVRNRLNKGMWHGLVALKRKDLAKFIDKECAYARNKKGVELGVLAVKAIKEVFEHNKDYVDGATHYEHTGHYGYPDWSKQMKVVEVLYSYTSREITFWRSK